MEKTMKKRESESQAGFTLVELLIAVTITTVVVGSLVGVFSNQSRVYTQQSELAQTQAATRSILYFMSREVRLAGYSGIPCTVYGLAQSTNYQFYPVISVRDGQDREIAGTGWNIEDSKSLAGSLKAVTGTSDVIELYGQFTSGAATVPHLSATAPVGATQLQVSDVTFYTNPQGWVVIGRDGSRGVSSNLEIVHYSAVSSPASGADSSGALTIDSALIEDHIGDPNEAQTFVGPVERRVYYLNQNTGELFARTCLDETCTASGSFIDSLLAQNIADIQFTYTLLADQSGVASNTDLATITVEDGMSMICDPCRIRNVNITLTARMDRFRGNAPVQREFTTSVRVRNVGFERESCPITGCVSF